MNVALPQHQHPPKAALGIIDCDIHPTVGALSDLYPFMAQRWIDHVKEFGASTRQVFTKAGPYARYNRDGGARLDARPPGGGPSGSDLAFMRQHHLNANGIDIGILQALQPQAISARNQGFAAALTGAINDWQYQAWCSQEPRLKGSIMVTREDTDAALREIERWAGKPEFVQISTMPHGLEPLGRARYWPIFEAAEAHGLPIGIHVGGISGMAPTGTGWPSFYVEEHHSKCEAMQALMVSLVIEGVFERFPKLRIVLIEGGFVWVPSLAWRLDKTYKRLKSEAPHLRRLPSNYIRDHFWYTTQPIEEPEPSTHLTDVIDWIGWDRILFSTDYPHWDFDSPKHAFRVRLSGQQRASVFRENAQALYGLA